MVSICTCATNNKPDLELFIRSLHRHNNPADFEICITHDTRVEDGTAERLKELQQEFQNIKVITWTKEDTVLHLEKLLDIYEKQNLLQQPLIDGMRGSLELYKRGDLFPTNRSFLWLSSGVLYNKAVSISSGNFLVITPSDFMYMFRLKDLEIHMQYNQVADRFYSSPNAIWARLTNLDKAWLEQHIEGIHNGNHREGFRWDTNEVFRDYLRMSSDLNQYTVPDFKTKIIHEVNDPEFTSGMKSIIEQAFGDNPPGESIQAIRGFHGFHAMTRRSYDDIGGFEELWFGRAFADDKMTFLGGQQPGPYNLDPEFSVIWCGQHELAFDRGPKYPPDWKDYLAKIDPIWDKHPIPPNSPTYLYDGFASSSLHEIVNKNFSKTTKPTRIST